MAMKKNNAGIIAAIQSANQNSEKSRSERAHRALPKGTIGAVAAGVNGIQDIDTLLIEAWGPRDRLDVSLTAVNSESEVIDDSIHELAASISDAGQQVPVLLKPSAKNDGHFEVVYGQRRILACKHLGIPVKALVRTLNENEALIAKGLENSNRKDLSFYERARFAQAIMDEGYSRSETCQALTISKNTLSQLEKVFRNVPKDVGNIIGAAPQSGRPKWMALATAFENETITTDQAATILQTTTDADSDTRLNALLKGMKKPKTGAQSPNQRTPIDGVTIKSESSKILLSFDAKGKRTDFAHWLDARLDSMIENSFEQFKKENAEE